MEREWTVGGGGLQEVDRQQVHQMLADMESIGHYVGGFFVIVPLRAELPDGEYVTVGWTSKWKSFAPAGRVAEPEQPEAVEDDGAGRAE